MIIKDRYRPGELLAHGPLGDVFMAEDMETGLYVIIRALERHLTVEQEALEALERDTAILRELDLPTTAPYQHIFFHEGSLHLVSPYLPGQTLEEYLAEHGPLPPSQLREWGVSLARTLEAAHVNTVVHGDVRPNNVFVVRKDAPPPVVPPDDSAGEETEPSAPTLERPPASEQDGSQEAHPADTPGEMRLVIKDFGLFRLLENRRLATTTARLNLSNFTSPQRWHGNAPTISDDIWNTGVLLFLMASGRLPFDGESDAAIMQRVLHHATPNLRGRVQRGQVAVIERLLEKDPWRRYRSLGAVISDLERGSVRWPGRRAGLMPRERSPLLSWGIFLFFVVVLLGIPAGGGAAFLAQNQPTATAIEVAGVVFSPTPTFTQTPVVLPFQPSPSGPPTATATPTATWTPIVITNTPTLTFTPSDTPTITPTATITPSRTPTVTASASPTATHTPTQTPPPTGTPPPSDTPSPMPTDTATVTLTPSASPTATATFTPTATPTSTPNFTATLNYEAFLTRAAVLQATQLALDTRTAPTDVPDLTATSIALTPAAAALAAQYPPRTGASAVPLCAPGENLVTFSGFNEPGGTLTGLPNGFLFERIDRDYALHITRTGTWSLPLAEGYTRVRFDMLAPRAATPPLTISFVPVGQATNRVGWRLTWAISTLPEGTGLLLEQVRGGQPETVSSLVAVPFDQWVTVDMSFQPLGDNRTVFTLTAHTPGGPRTALLVLNNTDLTPFSALAINATIDSAPWLDNLLICSRPAPIFGTPTPQPAQ